MSDVDNYDSESVTKEAAYFTEAVNQILFQSNCPESVRSFIDYLIGYSKGRLEFEVSDAELSFYEKPSEEVKLNNDTEAKWVQRKRDKLEKHQVKIQIPFIECQRGSWNPKAQTYHKSKYKLFILEYAVMVVAQAKKNLSWKSNTYDAIRHEAHNLLDKLKNEKIVMRPRKSRKREGRVSNMMLR